MINREIDQARKQRIQRISQEIENLSAQLNQLIIQDQLAEREEQQDLPTREQEFHIGDRVEITNNYKGLRGAQGVITHITAQQVSLRVDGHRRVINKKKTNVRRILAQE
jgi:transcription antitermination factor NusG